MRGLWRRDRCWLASRSGALGAGPNCGLDGNTDCCASLFVPGGSYNRLNDPQWPATVSPYSTNSKSPSAAPAISPEIPSPTQLDTPRSHENPHPPRRDDAPSAALAQVARPRRARGRKILDSAPRGGDPNRFYCRPASWEGVQIVLNAQVSMGGRAPGGFERRLPIAGSRLIRFDHPRRIGARCKKGFSTPRHDGGSCRKAFLAGRSRRGATFFSF